MGFVILLWHSLSLPYNYFVILAGLVEDEDLPTRTQKGSDCRLDLDLWYCLNNQVWYKLVLAEELFHEPVN